MSILRLASATAALVTLIAVAVPGCSNDKPEPAGDAAPQTVRVFWGDETKTWQLVGCVTESDSSLTASGGDSVGGLLVIDITDGTGTVTELPAGWPNPTLEGELTAYSMGDDGLFAASGTYTAGDQSGDGLRLEGNCNQVPTAAG